MTIEPLHQRRIVSLVRAAAPALLMSILIHAASPAWAQPAATIPARPEQIAFPPLTFQPPRAADFRHTLASGVAVYLAPSHEFPLIDMTLTFRGGAYLDPPDQIGLASATGAMIRRGGAAAMSPQALDEEFDYLAANVRTAAGDTEASASINCLASNFEQAFSLFMQMLRTPGFDAARLAIFQDEVVEAMKQRNDQPASIASRTWSRMLYGADHYHGRESTAAMIRAITLEQLRTMHARLFNPAPDNLIIAVTGDFEPTAMLARLESALKDWTAGSRHPDPPAPAVVLAPGLYHVEKDIPQGRVIIGMRGITRDDPDYFPMLLMNDILGGGGFTSRITSRVRSDEGLAYSAGSAMIPGVYFPGEVRAGFESKNPTVALATRIVLEEVDRIRKDLVTEEELDTSKKAFIERFPRTFESKPTMLRVFVSDEMTGRDPNYWQTYRDKVQAVTREEVLRVARARLDPSKLAVLVVGKWREIEPGDLEGRAAMKDVFAGQVTHLPLLDPLTLQPMTP